MTSDRIEFFTHLEQDMVNGDTARRGTGRTHNMIAAMQEGDVLIVNSHSMGQTAREIAKKLDKNIIIHTAGGHAELERNVMQMRGHAGEIFIDHYLMQIIVAQKIKEFEKMVGIIRVRNVPFSKKENKA